MIEQGANPLLDHAWGLSPGADRIWAQIAGIAPSSRPWKRIFVILQAYVDESYNEGGTFVMAGYVASVDAWARFSQEWELLLPLAMRSKRTNRQRFKMSEMTAHMDRVEKFYRVIEQHVLLGLSCKIDISEFESAKNSIQYPNVNFNWRKVNHYNIAFHLLMANFHYHRVHRPYAENNRKILGDVPIEFYFDDITAKKPILNGWEDFLATIQDPTVKSCYGSHPRFENDECFLPLQAADFTAWWIRNAYGRGDVEQILKRDDYGTWQGQKHINNIHFWATKKDLVKILNMLAVKEMNKVREE